MIDDLRAAFTKPARQAHKGPPKGPYKGRGQKPAPATSRKPD
jgi:ribonuclease P protein component